jgi:hypothetical protein
MQTDPSRGWGSGAAGTFGDGSGAVASAGGVQVDPGSDPSQSAELGGDIDPMGLLQGARRPGTGPRMDGVSGAAGSAGSGSVSGTVDEGGRVSGGSRVPGSLRAYVRRYLSAVGEGGSGTGTSGTGSTQ